MDGLQELIDGYKDRPNAVIGLLQDVSRLCGFLPEDVLEKISVEIGIPVSRLYSLATFYSAFRLEPLGKHKVCVCIGTACHVKGAARIVDAIERDLSAKAGQTTADGLFTIETVNCLGACALAPLVVLDEEYHGRMDSKKASKLVESVSAGGADPAAGKD
jgi:NADH-quinone oxidoreductase subunit E